MPWVKPVLIDENGKQSVHFSKQGNAERMPCGCRSHNLPTIKPGTHKASADPRGKNLVELEVFQIDGSPILYVLIRQPSGECKPVPLHETNYYIWYSPKENNRKP